MKCPYCKSEDIVKAGKKYNKYVEKQFYLCKSCRRRFVERDGFEKMSYPKEIILKTLHLYAEGLSLSKIRDFIWQHEGYYLYDSVILYLVRKYARLLKDFEKKLKPKIKGRHMDEVILKEKGKKIHDINAVDGKTDYNLSHLLTDSLSLPYSRKFFKELKFDRFFSRTCKPTHGVPIACKRYGLRYNNNPIERYKVMRCFKSFESADIFPDLRRMIYNSVRGDETRAIPALIALKLGRNGLEGLIKF
ncbi:MAG: hypothetical protein DRN12_03165 [Thermoplasmata archaeon]|nr:MAG: hypothetical protein DRN12_03165 [Thermoplasmata archaeon]